MNIILFSTQSEALHLESEDPRARHIRKVLKMTEGDSLFVGVVNGCRGKARILSDCPEKGLDFEIEWDAEALSPFPVQLVIGLPRPQTARKILQECTTLGAEQIVFFQSEKGEKSYAESKLWTSGEWKRHLWAGAEQAFNTTIPEIKHFSSLESALVALKKEQGVSSKVALDVYEAKENFLAAELCSIERLSIAIGPERGWAAGERDCLRAHDYAFYHLGDRVLRAETACTVALAASIRMLHS